jgi:hypothetical protein
MANLVDIHAHQPKRKQLLMALRQWVIDTKDDSVFLESISATLEK